ncbi:MAG: ChbG/HpnK family deacetylase [Acidobacteriaceae bacterium]|nr:ChbG/HpnK family deacetylase [Acidobacteriaceae bacterium]
MRTLAGGGLNVYGEFRAQIEKIRDTGISITHLDSHKHTHIVPSIFRAVIKLAREFNIPYVRLPLDHTTRFAGAACQFADRYYRRFAQRRNVQMTDHFLGFRLTGNLTEESFVAALQGVQEGTTEFMCHPGFLDDELRAAPTRLKEQRVRELEALTSPRIRELMDAESIHLATFCKTTPRAAQE